jgi:stage II sporulation protein D
MRRVLLLTVLSALVAVPAAAAAPPAFWVGGHGWGHGIGMPQYGAYGYAREEGKKYDWILAHYYKGTTLGAAPISTVRVLLAEGRKSVKVGSTAPFTATDARGRTFAFPAKTLTLGPGLKVKVNGRMRTLASAVTFKPGSRNLQLGGRAYRGRLVLRSGGSRVNVVNSVGLEKYLFGVVPDEMPPSWSAEALKAQAVAARSYAVVSRKKTGTFDLFSDTRSQVYGGVPSEDARSTAAIQATAGKVVKYKGAVAWTFFHSTSGGRTAAIQHVWNASPLPYLVSVADPHDGISPYHSWGPFRYSAAELGQTLGSLAPAGALRDATVDRNGSMRVDTVTFRGTRGSRGVSGSSVQARLGLRSSWFSVSVLQLGGPGTTAAGKLVKLNGLARGFSKVWLERRTGSGKWQRVRDLAPSGGKVTTKVRPRATSWFRLGSARGTSPAHRVKVTTAGAQRAAALGELVVP